MTSDFFRELRTRRELVSNKIIGGNLIVNFKIDNMGHQHHL